MLIMVICLVLFTLLTLLLMFLHLLISPQETSDTSPYECGFSPNGSGRRPFSLRFFLLAILFVIFDVELVILYPLLFWQTKYCVLSTSIFTLILLLGLLHEGLEGTLDWKI